MIIVLKPNISKRDEAAVIKEIKKLGYRPHIMRGVARTVIGAIGDELKNQTLENLPANFPQSVEERDAGAEEIQAGEPRGASVQFERERARKHHRRQKTAGDGGAVFSGKREAVADDGGGGEEGGGRRFCAEASSSRGRRRTNSRGWG